MYREVNDSDIIHHLTVTMARDGHLLEILHNNKQIKT